MRLLLILTALLSPLLSMGEPGDPFDASSEDIAGLFERASVDGTFVLSSLDGSKWFVHNEDRSHIRFSPASTFKIFNTLVGLDSGAVTSRNSVFSWDGTDRGVTAWNQDQTLQSAFRVSCVWCYQEIARSVGKGKYLSVLASVGYGNQAIGDHVDQFWLDGSLKISAVEQVAFLKKLYSYELPYDRDVIDELKAIMLDERSSNYVIYGKTGWTGARLHTGWYVGFVEVDTETWIFALNLEMNVAEQAPLRKQLALSAMQVLGITR